VAWWGRGGLAGRGPPAPGRAAGGAPERAGSGRGGGPFSPGPSATGPARHITLAALEPKFFEAFCRGAGCEHLIAHQFDPPGTPAHAALEEVFAARTLAEWEAFAAEHDCCLEPVRTVEEALRSPLVRDRGMVVEVGDLEVLGTPVV